jgi:hypothetical protein
MRVFFWAVVSDEIDRVIVLPDPLASGEDAR